jgi:hypothetical protein
MIIIIVVVRSKDIWMLALGPLRSEFSEKELLSIESSMEEIGIVVRGC